MCFSATASFTAAAVLIPSGVFCLKQAGQLDRRYQALALLPVIFGLQQAIEGGIWLSLAQGEADRAHVLALGFLLFSHVFWLGWIPYSAYRSEDSASLQKMFRAISLFGLVFGASMYLPLLFHHDWVSVAIVNHSIVYDLRFYTDPYLSKATITVVYAGVILLPLMLCSDRGHRVLGVLLLLSGLATWLFFDWVFISVWCYFAALISLYIFVVVARGVKSLRLATVPR